MKVIRINKSSSFSRLFEFIKNQEALGLRYLSHQPDEPVGDIYFKFETTSVLFDDGLNETSFVDLTANK